MLEENEVENEERKRYIEELVTDCTRNELNEIARGLGLNPRSYPNKWAIAEAILEAREGEELHIKEIPEKEMYNKEIVSELMEEEIPILTVEEEVEKVFPNTVRGMMKAIDEKAANFNGYASALTIRGRNELKQGIDAFNQSVIELSSDYERYTKKDFQNSVQNFHRSVMELINNYNSYMRIELQRSIDSFLKSVKDFQNDITEHAEATQGFIIKFYG